jgi:hypothetical protein
VKQLYETATALAGGKNVDEVCRSLGVIPATYHRWQKEYDRADLEIVWWCKLLKELVEGKWYAQPTNRRQLAISSVP